MAKLFMNKLYFTQMEISFDSTQYKVPKISDMVPNLLTQIRRTFCVNIPTLATSVIRRYKGNRSKIKIKKWLQWRSDFSSQNHIDIATRYSKKEKKKEGIEWKRVEGKIKRKKDWSEEKKQKERLKGKKSRERKRVKREKKENEKLEREKRGRKSDSL